MSTTIDGLTEALRKGFLKMVLRDDGEVGYQITPEGVKHVEEVLGATMPAAKPAKNKRPNRRRGV